MNGPKPALVVGAVLGGLVVASHGLLRLQIGETNELLRAIVGAQQAGLSNSVPSYTDEHGTTRSAEIVASPIEVSTPAGEFLTGVSELDMMGRMLTVTSDDRSKGSLIRDIGDPVEFFDNGEAMWDLPNEMLLELHGWQRARWPEGWSP